MIERRFLARLAGLALRPRNPFGFFVTIDHEPLVEYPKRLGVDRTVPRSDAEELRQRWRIDLLQPRQSLCRRPSNADLGMPSALRADDAKLLMLGIWVPHVDGKTRLPDRQAENRLVIGNCGRTELRFVSMDPILDASVDQAAFGAA